MDAYEKDIDKYWELERGNQLGDVNIFTVRIIKPKETRAMCEEFEAAKAREVEGLK